jgi:hypothetical protein
MRSQPVRMVTLFYTMQPITRVVRAFANQAGVKKIF